MAWGSPKRGNHWGCSKRYLREEAFSHAHVVETLLGVVGGGGGGEMKLKSLTCGCAVLAKLVPFNCSNLVETSLNWKCLWDCSFQVLLTLRFLAAGCYQREVADLHGVTQPTVSRRIHGVIQLIASMKDGFIVFPTAAEQQEIQRRFYQQHGLPGVVSAVDGTHIPIVNPGGLHSELYRNRKRFFSINTQIFCDDRMVIRDIVASWHGSTHDARIFNLSSLKDKLEQLPPHFQ